ncbi:MAG: dual specificity protein phosphatase family protein [Myxococcales bacterium]|nr:dual specificity protein phosphatase family protein [Myxococcales bacterium]
MLYNFGYVLEKKLAGSAYPGMSGDLRADLREAKQRGISAVVTLTETPLEQDILLAEGMEFLHLPIGDYQPPSLSQIEDFVRFVRGHLATSRGAVLVHCMAGRGRAGTMLACFLVAEGWPAELAIRHVRESRPGSIETLAQEEVIEIWERHLAVDS